MFSSTFSKRAWGLDNIVLKTFMPVYDTIPKNAKRKILTFKMSTEIQEQKMPVYVWSVSLLIASKYFAKIISKVPARRQIDGNCCHSIQQKWAIRWRDESEVQLHFNTLSIFRSENHCQVTLSRAEGGTFNNNQPTPCLLNVSCFCSFLERQ